MNIPGFSIQTTVKEKREREEEEEKVGILRDLFGQDHQDHSLAIITVLYVLPNVSNIH